VKLYRFEDDDPNFELLPLAARRALDQAGRRLSLDGYRSLPEWERKQLAELGSVEQVDVARVIAIASMGKPPATEMVPATELAPGGPDSTTVEAYGSARPIPVATWSALSALDRYALFKVARGKSAERIGHAYAEIVGQSAFSSHVAADGGVRMVGVGRKEPSLRRAEAESCVIMNAEAFQRVTRHDSPKGDVLGTARIAAIMAAKRTSELIPLCHPLSLTKVDVQLSLDSERSSVDVAVAVECFDRTGVEMEALTAASVAALTVYDMLKSIDRGMEIGPTRLVHKSGGRSGDFNR
jgi:cyclic pyranopterin phosphate synthase